MAYGPDKLKVSTDAPNPIKDPGISLGASGNPKPKGGPFRSPSFEDPMYQDPYLEDHGT